MLRYFQSYLIENLLDRVMKVALPSQLNDPFDFALTASGEISKEAAENMLEERLGEESFYDHFRETNPHLSNDEIRNLVSKNKETVIESYMTSKPGMIEHFKKKGHEIGDIHCRLLCFSDPRISPISDVTMWAHYGDSHKGYRVFFDTEFLERNTAISKKEVVYKNKRVSIPLSLSPSTEAFRDLIKLSMHTKGRAWKGENEVRFLINPRLCLKNRKSGLEFIEFPESSIRRIDLGINSPEDEKEKILFILSNSNYKHVEVFQSSLDEKSYQMNYIKLR